MLPLLKLNPVAFSLGGLSVHWYGLIIGTGALLGLLLAIREGKRFGIPSDFFLDLMLFGVPSAIIAARLYYVGFKWDYYSAHPGEIVEIWNGGIAIYGAILGALICGFFYSRYKGYSFWRIVDICAPSLLIGQMIGRWGNYVNQEAYGGPVSENFLRHTLHLPAFIVNQMYVVDPTTGEAAYHHPTFFYESMWSLLGVIILFVIRRQWKWLRTGEMFFAYLIWYSIGRFFIEALRTDSLAFKGSDTLASFINWLWTPMTWFGFKLGYLDPAYGNVRISQLLAILFIVASLIIAAIRRQTGMANARYSDPIVNTKTPSAKDGGGSATADADTARSADDGAAGEAGV